MKSVGCVPWDEVQHLGESRSATWSIGLDDPSMKRIRIIHLTEYYYHAAVTFGPHRALLRPREGHDLHIESSRLEIEPQAEVRWLRDVYGNSIAIMTFTEPARKLRLLSEVNVDLYDDIPIDCVIDPIAHSYPFQYAANEQVEIIPYRLPSYPHDGPAVQRWLSDIYRPGQLVNTSDLLDRLNTHIYETFQYVRREEPGVQLPCQTLALGSGSCRDYAVFMMEAARHWGFGSRFVTGYIQMGEGQHGATHAWTEIYIPGAGWRGYDPTNNKLVGTEHVSVAVAREQDKASPLSGTWEGPPGAWDRMEVSVQVVAL
jgi:transglutaminase-like putative cysteine protease